MQANPIAVVVEVVVEVGGPVRVYVYNTLLQYLHFRVDSDVGVAACFTTRGWAGERGRTWRLGSSANGKHEQHCDFA